MTVYGTLVERHGLAASHALLLEEVPPASRVLDVGCAEGYLAALLKEKGCEVVGMEADARAAEIARSRGVVVIEGDVEDAENRDRAAAAGGTCGAAASGGDSSLPYDRVLFGDVLEHLRDPAALLRWALGVAPVAVVSLPNIGHWTARREVLRGRFPQADHGLFDRTHLRFFTRETARDLVEDAGWRVTREQFAGAPLPLESRVPALGRLRPALVSRRPELFALQVVLTCAAGAAP